MRKNSFKRYIREADVPDEEVVIVRIKANVASGDMLVNLMKALKGITKETKEVVIDPEGKGEQNFEWLGKEFKILSVGSKKMLASKAADFDSMEEPAPAPEEEPLPPEEEMM
jgi:hypothetical protein